ncbi:MAG: glycosyltransferase family 2 protein [Pseudomonadota bacterium]
MDILTPPTPRVARQSLSVVVPVYNEAEVLPEFHRRVSAVLDTLGADFDTEIVYVNDGSDDASIDFLVSLHQSAAPVTVVDLSRNFGKEAATSAGLDHARGDAIIIIDSDLQDPPELMPDMVRAWQSGSDVVRMRRASRANESWFKKTTARWFYRMIGRVSEIEIPPDVGDFRLLSRRAVDALMRFPERTRFMKGLYAWIGFPTAEITYDRDGRFAGESKWNYWQLWNFALEGITSFSVGPLKLASYIGFLTAVSAFAYGAYVVAKTLLYGDPVRGYPTLLVVVLSLGGLQLMALGIIGEYLARVFIDVKARPLYLVQRVLTSAHPLPLSTRKTESWQSR